MMWVPGPAADYDGWSAPGCTGWSYEELLPHFRRIAVTVSTARDPSPLTLALIEAAVECGIERTESSTGSSWKASASFRCRSATDGAVVLQTPTCDPLVGDGT